MIKLCVVVLLILLPALAEAQWLLYDTTLFTTQQELPLPPKESSDRWSPSALVFTSKSAYPQHVKIKICSDIDTLGWNAPRDTMWKLADSAYYMADSIYFATGKSWGTTAKTPWKFLDSTLYFGMLDFLLPANAKLRIPIRIRVNPHLGLQGDTVMTKAEIASYSDSAGKHRYCYPGPFMVRCPQVFTKLFAVRQESIPPNDSGGRWLPSAFIVTSQTAYAQDVQLEAWNRIGDPKLGWGFSRDSMWKLADSAYYLADSIFTYIPRDTSATPWKYIGKNRSYYQQILSYALSAYGTLRIPILVRATADDGPPGDTINSKAWLTSISDSIGIYRRFSTTNGFTVRCLDMYKGPVAAWQNSIPPNDSGGRWLPTAVTVKNFLAKDAEANIFINSFRDGSNNWTKDTLWKLADSAIQMAESNSNGILKFRVPPRGSIRVPIYVAAKGQPGNTTATEMEINCDTTDDAGNKKYIAFLELMIRCHQACPAPYVAYNGTPLNNQARPVVIGGQPYTFEHRCSNCSNGTSQVEYSVVGEYADRFKLPDPMTSQGWVQFLGAPKSPVYDTLLATYTNCWGTISTRTPITAHSAHPTSYRTGSQVGELIAPFLGKASTTVKIWNTSDFPITIRNLRSTGNDSVNFQAWAPSVIPAHDSAAITITLVDNNLLRDLQGTQRSAAITATVAPNGTDVPFEDSTFSISVQGKIDVWCPSYSAGSTMQLKQGDRLRGIIFSTGKTEFLTVYGNFDSEPKFFYEPYFEDRQHFQAEDVELIIGKTIMLPALVPVDTGGFFRPAFVIRTTFTGDNDHNYFTKLHFPRERDTLTVDVLAVGTKAPPFLHVSSEKHHESPGIDIWPNPASRVVNVRLDREASSVSIVDGVGRIVKRYKLFLTAALICLPHTLLSQIRVEQYTSLTFELPVDIQNAGDGRNRLFVVEQKGTIRVFDNSATTTSSKVFLNITDRVRSVGNEEGLLGLAFHPNFETNGFLYVNYIASDPRRSIIARFTASGLAQDTVDPATQLVLLQVEQPFANHNAGQIRFGADGYLYIPFGDGGFAGDPNENGQNPATLLGSMLRIDVNATQDTLNYAIPASNPFVGNSNGWREETWAYGFRNPFRFSFDSQTGWLWMPDVGQDAVEEVNVIDKGGNYGWNMMEGSGCFDPLIRCDSLARVIGLKMPIWDYTHNLGETVIGGFVYRGTMTPDLVGKYIFSDFISGRIWALDYNATDTSARMVHLLRGVDSTLLISTYGVDEANEMYMASIMGTLYTLRGTLPVEAPLTATLEPAFTFTFERPVEMTPAYDGTQRLFVVEQPGRIRVFDRTSPGATAATFLDITDRVSMVHNEEGLLGLTFHPEYETNRFFYVYYSATGSPRRTVVARFTADASDPNRADPSSQMILLEVEQPFGNHKAGQLRFGSDGYLYIALGDGGDAGDPFGNGQNRATLLGSILRIDVNAGTEGLNYSIPADNPYVGNTNGWREEIWAYGFRNPFRFSFDPQTNWLWVSDAGQDKIEEISIVEKGGNHGWNIVEGSGCFNPRQRCDSLAAALGIVMPIWDYTHRNGNVIINGFVYRGTNASHLAGKFIYADLSGKIWALDYNQADTSAIKNHDLYSSDTLIAAFGVDQENELYVLGLNGTIYSLTADRLSVAIGNSTDADALSLQSKPNPFGDLTQIRYDIPYSATVELSIFDALGRKIRTLFEGPHDGGAHIVDWNGQDANGNTLAAGSYICRLVVDNSLIQSTNIILDR